MAVSLAIDGRDVPLRKAYNSRGVAHAGTFLGFAADLTGAVSPDVAHEMRVGLPELSPGQFHGVFWAGLDPDPSTAQLNERTVRADTPK